MPAAEAELAEIGVPDFGLPSAEPSVPTATYRARLAAATDAAVAAGLDALLILVPGRTPVLLVGNEGVAYAAVVPSCVDVIRYQSFSLVNQPRAGSRRLPSLLAEAGLGGSGAGLGGAAGPGARRVGIAGWKYFGPDDEDGAADWIEVPAYLVSVLRALGCEPVNASALF